MRKMMLTLICTCMFAASLAAVDGRGALYMGGTIPGLPEKTEGRLVTADETMTFVPKKQGVTEAAIPYASVTELEYGQKAGRRVGVAVMVSPLALFSKKRNHYLTITYKDVAGKEQAAVFELGKDIVRTTLKIIETRTGKEIHFQDDEAKKSLGGGK